MDPISIVLLVSVPFSLVAIFGRATVSLGGQEGRTHASLRTQLPDGSEVEASMRREQARRSTQRNEKRYRTKRRKTRRSRSSTRRRR